MTNFNRIMITGGTLVLVKISFAILFLIGRLIDAFLIFPNSKKKTNSLKASSIIPNWKFVELISVYYTLECCNRSLNTCSSTRSWVMMNKTLFPHLEILYFKWPSQSHQKRTRQVKHFTFCDNLCQYVTKWVKHR